MLFLNEISDIQSEPPYFKYNLIRKNKKFMYIVREKHTNLSETSSLHGKKTLRQYIVISAR